MKASVSILRILGALAAVCLLANCAVPSAEEVKVFTAADRPIAEELVRDGDGWSVVCDGPRTCRLFEVQGPAVTQCIALYRAALKSEELHGRAYIEMRCRFPQRGEFFSKGLDLPVSGTTDWINCQTPFFLRKGMTPDLIKLNLVVEGRGKVWIKNVGLFKQPES
ncbi:MAG: hypothetical protein NTY01_18250 [Verrucomicrobia bacterium]|nr:hypothetical protein [Verrucomicrobiota bacterium]